MYVYHLKSIPNPSKIYIGITENPTRRLQEHNSGIVPYTSKFKPWKIEILIWIEDREKAFKLEKYFKSHSGRAFAKKHFL